MTVLASSYTLLPYRTYLLCGPAVRYINVDVNIRCAGKYLRYINFFFAGKYRKVYRNNYTSVKTPIKSSRRNMYFESSTGDLGADVEVVEAARGVVSLQPRQRQPLRPDVLQAAAHQRLARRQPHSACRQSPRRCSTRRCRPAPQRPRTASRLRAAPSPSSLGSASKRRGRGVRAGVRAPPKPQNSSPPSAHVSVCREERCEPSTKTLQCQALFPL